MSRGFFYTLTLQDRFSRTLSDWDRGLQGAIRSSETAATRMGLTGAKIGAAFGAGLLISVPAMAASFIPLENALARLGTVFHGTNEQVEQGLTKSLAAARAWSSQHLQSTTDVIDAQFQLATAGLDVEESMAGVARAATLATATGETLGQSAQLLASLFNTFGQTADLALMPLETAFDSMADSIANTIRNFQVTITPLRQGLAFITGQAVQLGLSLDEVNVALGILNTAGIRASNAGTGLQNVFIRMDEAIGKLNLNMAAFTDSATGGFTSISDFIDEVARSLDTMGLTGFEKVLAIQEAMGQRAARTTLVLLSQRNSLRALTEEFRNTSGIAQLMADRIEATTGSRMKIAMNNVKNLAQTIGQGLVFALKGAADAIGPLLIGITNMAAKSPILFAATVGLTGAVMLGVAGWIAYNAVLSLTGKTAVSLTTALLGMGKALALTSILGAVTFAVGALVIALTRGSEIVSEFGDRVNASAFQNAEQTFSDLAGATAAAIKEQEKAANGGSFGGGFLSKLFSDDEVERIRSGANVLSEVILPKVEKDINGFFRSLTGQGIDGSFMVELKDAIAGLVDSGVEASVVVDAIGQSIALFQEVGLGGAEGANEMANAMGKMQAALDLGVEAWNSLVGATDSSIFPGQSISNDIEAVNSFSDALQQLRDSSPQNALTFTENFDPSMFLEGFNQMVGATDEHKAKMQEALNATRAFFDFINSEGFSKAFANDKEMMDAVAPILGADWEDSIWKAGEKGGERFNEGFFSQLPKGAARNAAEMTASVMQSMQDVIQQRAAEIRGAFATIVETQAFAGQVEELNKRITNSMSSFARLDDIMGDTGRTSAGLGSQLQFVGRAIDDQGAKVQQLHRFLEALQTLEARGLLSGSGPRVQALKEALEVTRRTLPEEEALLAAMTRTREATSGAKAEMDALGGSATEAQLKAAGIASALEDTLGAGTFKNFSAALGEEMTDTIRNGIVDGARAGFAAALGQKLLLSSEDLTKQVQQAFIAARTGASGEQTPFDMDKFRSAISGITEGFKESLAGAGDLSGIFNTLNAAFNTMDQASAAAFGNTEQRMERLKQQANGFNSEFQKTIDSLAEIQTSLIGASGAEATLGAEAINLLRGDSAFGFDVSTVEGMLSAAQRGLEIAREERLENTESARALREKAVEANKILEARRAAAGIDTETGFNSDTADKFERTTAQVVESLASVDSSKFGDLADELERGRDAAEAINEALAGLQNGTLIPSNINVSGSGSGVQITRGAITVNVTGGTTQQTIAEVEASLREELERELEIIRNALESK